MAQKTYNTRQLTGTLSNDDGEIQIHKNDPKPTPGCESWNLIRHVTLIHVKKLRLYVGLNVTDYTPFVSLTADKEKMGKKDESSLFKVKVLGKIDHFG